jgi:hypothetical protein
MAFGRIWTHEPWVQSQACWPLDHQGWQYLKHYIHAKSLYLMPRKTENSKKVAWIQISQQYFWTLFYITYHVDNSCRENDRDKSVCFHQCSWQNKYVKFSVSWKRVRKNNMQKNFLWLCKFDQEFEMNANVSFRLPVIKHKLFEDFRKTATRWHNNTLTRNLYSIINHNAKTKEEEMFALVSKTSDYMTATRHVKICSHTNFTLYTVGDQK